MPSVTFNKLQKRIRRLTATAIEQYNMIEDGDKVMVCLSGGKDSYTLLDILLSLQKVAPVKFELLAVNLDQKQPGFDASILPNYLSKIGVNYHIIEEDTYSIVKDKIDPGKTMCSLCSRLRRGVLYSFAKKNGITKIALGHHKDDILETFFLNLFFGGIMKSMPAKLKTDDAQHIVIRPLAYVSEKDIAKFAALRGYPIIPCNLCGSQENMQRQNIKKMIADWEKQFPDRKSSMFGALQNITPSHMMDRDLHDFKSLTTNSDSNIDITPTNSWLIPEKHNNNEADQQIITNPANIDFMVNKNDIPLIFHPK